jgi:hypothetical protein
MGTMIALTVATTGFFMVFTMIYILAKFFALPNKRATDAGSPPLQMAAPPSETEAPYVSRTRQEYVASLEGTQQVLRKIYRVLMYVIVTAFMLTGIYVYSIATAGNGLILVSIVLFAVGFVVWVSMSRFLQDEKELSSWTPETASDTKSDARTLWGIPIKVSKTVIVEEPTVVKLETDAIKTANELVQAGSDMDTVCHQINPEYAKWGSLRKELFRKTLEALLKTQGSTNG